MIFVEAPLFTKLLASYLEDDEYQNLQCYLIQNPDSGDLIQGTGGLRKLRWKTAHRGKRGGVRIIYYWQVSEEQIYLLTLYAKNEVSDLSPKDKKALKDMLERW